MLLCSNQNKYEQCILLSQPELHQIPWIIERQSEELFQKLNILRYMIELISDGTREKGGHSIFNDILLLIPNKSKWHCRYKHPMISLSGQSFRLFFTSFLHLTLKTRSFGQKLEIFIQGIDHGGELTLTLSPMAISWNCCFTDQVLFPLGNIIKRLAIKLFVADIFSEIYPD